MLTFFVSCIIHILYTGCAEIKKIIPAPKGLCIEVNHRMSLKCNFSKEQSMFPEDDRMMETCRSVLSVLMQILDY